MRKTIKKILIPITALSLLSTGAVFASEEPVLIQAPINNEATAQLPAVNGAVVDGVTIAKVGDVAMLPLRQVAEGLGYTVTWHAEDESITLTKGAQYIRMEIGSDAYSFGRMAPQSLGSAPVLVNDCTTHVPLSFVTEIIGGYYSENEDGSYKIVNPSIVSVSSVNEDGSLTVADNYLGEVIVYIDENTVIDGGFTSADIKKDMILAIEYSPAMTASLPAQTTAIRIRIENLPVDVEETPAEEVEFSGVITAIDGESILIGEEQDADAVRLIVTENTEIKHERNRRAYFLEDLEVGMKVSGTRSAAATFSIPAQSEAYSIQISE